MLPLIADSCYFGSDPWACGISQWSAAFGGDALFGTMVGSLLFLALYVAADGDMAVPTVAVILTGGVFVPMLPSNLQSISTGIVVIGLAAAVWQVLQKYVLNPSTV